MKNIFHNVRGTSDFYPPQSLSFEDIIQKSKEIFVTFGYEPIILPHLEEDGLFKKGVGEVTDIAQRQMFKINSKDIVLRPEGTAQVVRFYIEKSLYKQGDFHKFYYFGSMFRGERPQKGRFREFHHIGAEAIGSNSFYLDAEIIDTAIRIVKSAGIEGITLRINSLGCEKDKNNLASIIQEKLYRYREQLCDDCKRRLVTNPLRVLDCKKQQCRDVVSSLKIGKYLCDSCSIHFDSLLKLLKKMNIPYVHDPLLVRGLDYYTNTVFEITSNRLGSQDAVGAGGRYNNLIKNLGGPDIPAIGFALGIERMLLLSQRLEKAKLVDALVAYASSSVYDNAYEILRKLRDGNISSTIIYKDKSLKSQLKWAQKANIPFVIIVGDEELKKGCIVLRNMRESTQEEIDIDDLTKVTKDRIKQKGD